MGLALCLLLIGQAAPAPTGAEQEAFLAWLEQELVAVASFAGPPTDGDPLEGTRVEELLMHRRFIYLGEPDHYIEEKYGFRLLLLGHLLARGLGHLGMEMGRADGMRVDRYLASGDEAHLEDVSLYAAMAGRPFVAAERRFLRNLVKVRGGRELRYFGYDVDLASRAGFDDARARLGRLDERADAERVEHLLRRIDLAAHAFRTGNTIPLDGLLGTWDGVRANLEGLAPAGLVEQVHLDLLSLREGHRMRRALAAAIERDLETYPREAFARRETFMVRQLESYLAGIGSEARVCLMGHNLHLSRRSQGIRMKDLGHELSMWSSVGAHLASADPDAVASVWLLYDHGFHVDDLSGAVEPVEHAPETLEALLARASAPTFLLPLDDDDPRSGLLDRVWPLHLNGTERCYLRPREQADVIAFTRVAREPQR